MKELTPTQSRILAIIKAFIASHGYSPSIRELGTAAGISSVNGTRDHLLRLEAKGYIRRGRGARAIIVTGVDAPLANAESLLRRWLHVHEAPDAHERLMLETSDFLASVAGAPTSG